MAHLIGVPVALAILLIPAAATLLLMLVPGDRPRVVRAIAFAATFAVLVLAVVLTAGFSTTGAASETVAGSGASPHVYKHVVAFVGTIGDFIPANIQGSSQVLDKPILIG